MTVRFTTDEILTYPLPTTTFPVLLTQIYLYFIVLLCTRRTGSVYNDEIYYWVDIERLRQSRETFFFVRAAAPG